MPKLSSDYYHIMSGTLSGDIMNVAGNFKTMFSIKVAMLLGIPISRIEVKKIVGGSVIVWFEIKPPSTSKDVTLAAAKKTLESSGTLLDHCPVFSNFVVCGCV